MGNLREKTNSIRGDVPVDDQSFEAFLDLLEMQDRLKNKYSNTLNRLDIQAAKEAVESGTPASTAVGLWLSEEEVGSAVKAVAEIVVNRIPSEATSVQTIVDAWSNGRLKLVEVAKHMLAGEVNEADSLAGEAGVDSAAMKTLVAWSIQPAYTALSEYLVGEVDLSTWHAGRCPVCGSFARLGFVDRDGGFCLKCQFCGTEWSYQQGKCPFCGNDDSQLVTTVDAGKGKPFKLSVCHVCTGYWKIIDERMMEGEVPRAFYDIWTLMLDIVADRLLG